MMKANSERQWRWLVVFFKLKKYLYPDQEKALTGFLKELIFSSAPTKSISDPSPDLNKNTISLQNRKKRTVADVGKQY